MAREKFIDQRFNRSSVYIINHANTIIDALRAQGYTLTVRQLYYQFVQLNLIKNKQTEYKRLAAVIDNARKAGLIDWDAIEDRTRFLRRIPTYSDARNFIKRIKQDYAEALWANQPVYVEVWLEKDALLGVIERPCNDFRVSYLACRGYASSSELYEAGKRFARQKALGKRCVLIHWGDHDPSGRNMTIVNRDWVAIYSRLFTDGVEIRRLGMNMDQILDQRPPENPAKDTDSRIGEYRDYMREYADEFDFDPDDPDSTPPSWELDAFTPAFIDKLTRDTLQSLIGDQEQWDADLANERVEYEKLCELERQWDRVVSFTQAEKYRHHARGTEYRLLTDTGRAQCNDVIRDNDEVCVYQDSGGQYWVRPHDEFFDGRFVHVETEES